MSLGGTPATPSAPPFFPLNIQATAATADQTDVGAYNLADKDFAARFPGLVAARDYTVEQNYNDLTGPLDPTLENAYTTGGLTQSLNAFGEGGFGQGSAGRNTVTASVGRSILGQQDADRQEAAQLRLQNPERAFGLSGKDLSQLSIFNTGNANQAQQNAYSAQIAGIQGNYASNLQQAQLIAGLASSISRAYANG